MNTLKAIKNGGEIGLETTKIARAHTGVPTEVIHFLKNEIAQIRKTLDLAPRRNVAAVLYDVEGLVDAKIAVSGVRSGGSVALGMPKSPLFQTFVVEHTRAFDSEVKIFENLARGISADARGTILLISERPICDSCKEVIRQFTQRFPNIEILTAAAR
jgi:hypothetical protein